MTETAVLMRVTQPLSPDPPLVTLAGDGLVEGTVMSNKRQCRQRAASDRCGTGSGQAGDRTLRASWEPVATAKETHRHREQIERQRR